MERIEAKVAEILNDRELVLNKGENDGVSVGMRFAILGESKVNIKDPDTGQPLGSVDLPKTVVKVVRTASHLAVARTFRMVGTASPLSIVTGRGQPERFEIDETPRDWRYGESQAVKKGDRAVQTTGDEYDPDE